jgi:hypothetical protein
MKLKETKKARSITEELFKYIGLGDTEENLEKIKTIFELSDIAEKAGLTTLKINLQEIKQEGGFKLNILSCACRLLNLRALKFLVEIRNDVLSQLTIDEGDPSPLFAAIFQKNAKKAEEVAQYLIQLGANVNCKYSGSVNLDDNNQFHKSKLTITGPNLLHLVIQKEMINLAKLLLLCGCFYFKFSI